MPAPAHPSDLHPDLHPDLHADLHPGTPRRLACELAAIRRDIARLQRREAQLLASTEPRPGWPMQRLQAMGDMISTSSPSRIAV